VDLDPVLDLDLRIHASDYGTVMDPDPDTDPAIFFFNLQDANKKLFKKKFFCLLLFEGTFPVLLTA
jgi:hypothetical protein